LPERAPHIDLLNFISLPLQPQHSFKGHYKTWTLDSGLDRGLDSISGLEFRSPGVKGHLQLISSKAFDVGCRIC